MIKIIKKLKIAGYEFEVILKDRTKDGSERSGSMLFSRQIIWIDSNQNKEQQESSLLHEIIEVINMANDLNLNHQQICVLEVGLYQVLKDNFQ